MADGLRTPELDESVYIVLPLADAEGRLPQIHSATAGAHRLRSKWPAVPASCINLAGVQLCRSCFRLEIDPDAVIDFDNSKGIVHRPKSPCGGIAVPYRFLNPEETQICRRCW